MGHLTKLAASPGGPLLAANAVGGSPPSPCLEGVKRNQRVDRRDLAALRAFAHDDPAAELLLLFLAAEPLLIGGIRCEPLEPWLQQLQPWAADPSACTPHGA
jgi:hypothetical protein